MEMSGDPAEALTWQDLYELNRHCRERFISVLTDIERGELLPKVGLAVLQEYLHSTVHSHINRNAATATSCFGNRNVSVLNMVKRRLAAIKKRHITVLVTGEYSAGKSSFLNILMGGNYLPVDRGRVTKVVCEIRNCSKREATLMFHDKGADVPMQLSRWPSDTGWKTLQNCIQSKTYQNREIRRIVIRWPLPVLQGMFDHVQVIEGEEEDGDTTAADPIDFPRTNGDVDADDSLLADCIQQLNASYGGKYFDVGSVDSGYMIVTGANQSPGFLFVDADRSIAGDRQQATASYDENVVPKTVYDSGDEEATGWPHGNETDETKLKTVNDQDKGLDQTKVKRVESFGQNIEQEETAVKSRVDSTENTRNETEVKRLYSVTSESSTDDSSTSTSSGGQSTRLHSPTPSSIDNFDVLPVSFVDCPGIDEEDMGTSFHNVLAELDSCNAFIFIIDSIRDDGIKKQGLQALFRLVTHRLANNGMVFDTDSALFIANKADTHPNSIMKEVFDKLQKIFPSVAKDTLVTMRAKKVLRKMSTGNFDMRNGVFRDMQRFLHRAFRVSLEEHVCWLMKMLGAADSLCQISSLSMSNAVRKGLERAKADAISLQSVGTEKIIMEERLIKDTLDKLQNVLTDCRNHIQAIDWSRCLRERIGDNFNQYDEGDDRQWQNTYRNLHEIIVHEINACAAVRDRMEGLKKSYEEELNKIYKDESHKLKMLERSLSGLDGEDQQGNVGGNPYAPLAVVELIAPVLLGAAFRVTPVGFGVMLILWPLAPVAWLIKSIFVDERNEYKYRKEIDEFQHTHVAFIQRKVNEVLDTNRTELHSFFTLDQNETRRRQSIHAQSERIKNAIDYVLGSTSAALDEQNKRQIREHCMQTTRLHIQHFICKGTMVYNEEQLGNTPGQQMRHSTSMVRGESSGDDGGMERASSDQEDGVVPRLQTDGWVDGVSRRHETGELCRIWHDTWRETSAVWKEVCIGQQTSQQTPDNTAQLLPEPTTQRSISFHDCMVLRQLSKNSSDTLARVLTVDVLGKLDATHVDVCHFVLERGDRNATWLMTQRPVDRNRKGEFLHYARQMCESLQFLHDRNVIHAHVKPVNFLLVPRTDVNGANLYKIKLSAAGIIESTDQGNEPEVMPSYEAPEVTMSRLSVTKASDVYSLGLVFMELWFRESIDNLRDTKKHAFKMPNDMPKEVKTIICRCLDKQAKRRSDIGSILEVASM